MKLTFKLLVILVANISISYGQSRKVEIPRFDDEYSKTVSKLEEGKTDVDFLQFRESFLESQQFQIAGENSERLKELKEKMYQQMENSEFQQLITTTKEILSIDYTNILAHKILRQTYEIIEDDINAAKYKAIQFGLLYSIVQNGDGKTCQTAWPVIQISEEYFILEMLNAKLISQSIDNKNGICDKMKVLMEGEVKTYYFNTNRIFQQKYKGND